MKQIIFIVLSIAAAGSFAIENTPTPDCGNCETVDTECCCDGTVDGCEEDCSTCDSCDCDCEDEGCSDCEEECTCDAVSDDCSCDDCSCEEEEEEEEEIPHCGGCH